MRRLSGFGNHIRLHRIFFVKRTRREEQEPHRHPAHNNLRRNYLPRPKLCIPEEIVRAQD